MDDTQDNLFLSNTASVFYEHFAIESLLINDASSKLDGSEKQHLYILDNISCGQITPYKILNQITLCIYVTV